MMIELEKLSTEENNPNSKDIELQDSLEIVRRINEEDKKVAFCVEKELGSISRLIDAILSKYKKETRIIYIGAGTSGRLGILDASECPPTYGVSFEKVQGIIAGGNEAIFKAKENAEDKPELGKQDLLNINLTENDVVPYLTDEKINDLSDAGKISFGVDYNGKKQDLEKAIENALQSYEDGIYRVFVNDEEIGEINDKMDLQENDELTFVRLTMLAGRMW